VGKLADVAVFAVPDRTAILYHFGVNHCRSVIKRGRIVAGDGVRTG
jgi:imidazolonepropionase-like amidohydrolase